MDYESRIRELAHRFWELEGRPHGRHEEHWHRACRDLRDFDPTNIHQPGTLQSTAMAGDDFDQSDGTPDFMAVDEVGVSADRITSADNHPAGSLPRRIL